MQSLRVADRLGELYKEAEPYAGTTAGRELREQIRSELAAAG
ncbi:hypothetical protein ACFQ7M_35885 [Streptomyces massasporeus]